MLKLVSLKQQKQHICRRRLHAKMSPAELRMQRDINELVLPNNCSMEFPDSDDLLNFKLILCPEEGFYRDGRFVFTFHVGPNYPHEPPSVKCNTLVYHPNIDHAGNVCLNSLGKGWTPVYTISSIVYGLLQLFLEPDPNDPLNKEAAEDFHTNLHKFEQNVKRSMLGGKVGQIYYDRAISDIETLCP